jgi:hypothetical protein
LKEAILLIALIYHAIFRHFTVMQDMAGFQGNNGAMAGRRIARTTTGYVCLVPKESGDGDSIVLLEGGKVPLVIRASKSGPQRKEFCKLKRWQIVGEAYVHGAMKGEAFEQEKCERFWFS